jgi:ketosteroid isomerase-like protein
MRITLLTFCSITLLIFLTCAAQGDSSGPPDAVAAFHAALTAGDKEGALELLAPGLILFEDGHVEMSRDEYGSGHLEADLKFSRKVKRELVAQQSNTLEDTAWVMSRYRTKGRLSGKKVTIDTTETMVLRRVEQAWRIVHVHWSNNVRQ